jgi:methionyl-tRNA formyltransferase
MEAIKILLMTSYPKIELVKNIIENGYQISCIILPAEKKFKYKSIDLEKYAKKSNLNVLRVLKDEILNKTTEIDYNIIFSCGYPFILNNEILKSAQYAVNFHPTLLPKHRGKYLHYILIDGDKHSGVTAHIMDSGIDTGPIVGQKSFNVSRFDTVKSLYRKSSKLELKLAVEILDSISKDHLKMVAQDNSKASTYIKQRTPKDSEIDPNLPLVDLFDKIRSCDEDLYPAFFYLDNQKVLINIKRENKGDDEFDMI